MCLCSVHVTNAPAGVRAALAQQRGGRAFLMAPEPSLDSALVLWLVISQTHRDINTHQGWWRTRKDERERSNKEGWEDLMRGRIKEKEKLTLCLRVSMSVADNAEGSQKHQSALFSSFTGEVCPLLTALWTAPGTLPVVSPAWHSHVWRWPPSSFHDDVSWSWEAELATAGRRQSTTFLLTEELRENIIFLNNKSNETI